MQRTRLHSMTIGLNVVSQGCSVYSLRWAVSIVMSRENQIPFASGPALALVPFWDCMNHDNGKVGLILPLLFNVIGNLRWRRHSTRQQEHWSFSRRRVSQQVVRLANLVSGSLPSFHHRSQCSMVLGPMRSWCCTLGSTLLDTSPILQRSTLVC